MANAVEDRKMSLTGKHDVAHIEHAGSVAKEESGTRGEVEDPVLEKRLNRKFDMHILPWLFGIW